MSTRTWSGPGAGDRQRILASTTVVAVVGASSNPARASFFVSTYLLASTGFTVYFVNPHETTILGRPVYPCLAALPETPELVDVFRRLPDVAAVLAEAIEARASTFWMQLGLWDEAVAADAEAAGLQVVMDRCLKIEHARFHGGLHLAGFDTGVIDSRRPVR
ncbi:MAG: CoA-binding protein, partial [Mycobacteriaceae bacterium]